MKPLHIHTARNFKAPATPYGTMPGSLARKPNPRDLNQQIAKVQLARVRQDVLSWRNAINEAEQAWFPHRVKMQQIFVDTVLNGHVTACIERRYDLTLQKDFAIADKKGKVDEYWTEIFKGQWFYDMLKYVIDAQFYGYSLINWTGIDADKPTGLQLIRRWNISPDRNEMSNYIYMNTGINFLENPEVEPWTLWVPTPSDHGVTPCGMGLLYKAAIYEIFCRNVLGYNGDFVELYSQPVRVGRTSQVEGPGRDAFEAAIRDMGSAAYAIIDPQDEIEFIESQSAGTGWKGYESLEARCEKKISKIFFGHADAIDSTTGKLGGGQGGEESPVSQAIETTQSKQNRFVTYVVNDILLPKFRAHGMNVPDGFGLFFLNDEEKMEQRAREDENNMKTINVVKTLHEIGIPVKPGYITERTGIEIDEVAAVSQEAEELKAAANLRGSVGGVQGIIQLQQSVSMGLTTPEAAIATLVNVYKFDEKQASDIVGKMKESSVKPPLTEPIQNKLKKLYAKRK